MTLPRLTLAALLLAGTAHAATIVALKNAAPDGVLISFQLTDGTVLVQGQNQYDWWKLTPDAKGSYVDGTWKQMASLPAGYSPYAFASAVLADGRLLICGGEYNNSQFAFTNQSEIYDPLTNKWTRVQPPKGWGFIGDSPSTVLPDGGYLLGQKFTENLAVLDPKTLTWTALPHPGKADFNAEEGWTLLPDGSVFTVDVKNYPYAELYAPGAGGKSGAWESLGKTPNVLAGPPEAGPIHYGKNHVYHPPGEVGPAILRPDGTVFATGALPRNGSTGLTDVYTPGKNGAVGSWAKGPAFPNGDSAGDSFAALLPDGDVLSEGLSGELYDFNGTSFADTKLSGNGSMLVLPTGEVLLGGSGVYRDTGKPEAGWAPTITDVATTLARGTSITLTGTQLNGLSQASAFGDEDQNASNYPLVRITDTATGTVTYARTHDHSSMGVATGSTPVTTTFDVPASAPTGAGTLVVVANGIASKAVNVTVK